MTGTAQEVSGASTSFKPRWFDVYLLGGMRLISFIGDLSAATAIALYLQSQGHSQALVVAALVASTAPAVLFAPLVGRLADRIDSRALVSSTALLQATGCVAMAIWPSPFTLIGGLFLLSLGLAVTSPVFGALPQSMVGSKNVAKAASISQTGAMLGMLAGPAVGAFMVQGFGVSGALFVDACSFIAVVGGTFALRTRLNRSAPGNQSSTTNQTDFAQTPGSPHNFSAWRHELLGPLLLTTGLVVTCVSINNVLSVFLVRDVLGGSEADYGLVGTFWMIGLVVGALAIGRMENRPPALTIVIAYVCMGAALLLSGMVFSVGWLLPVSILGGFGNGAMATSLHVVINLNSPSAHRGKAFAALGAVSNAAPMTGYLLGGVLLAVAGPALSYTVIGWAALLAASVSILVLRKTLLRVDKTDV
ncbi:MFS transporter [Arthrobacter sp. ISL-48]|uniref:MFS transporter n=1 Tax=Arthrobacter sp. ISL-48 TaxID=2819110 RepID=UPI001BE61A2E|nr:MFS transporter [Arthrobacter sp. ISL-48]MBT2531246.1 MFS transporter [Arthrobacter sp. ISL-48]